MSANRPDRPEPTADTTTTRPTASYLRARLGAALQKHRLQRGLTQSRLAELADLSLKYVGEIERGEANTTLDALERLADVVGWDPLETFEGMREPVTEGVRVLLITEVQQIQERLTSMAIWLRALDPALHPAARLLPSVPSVPNERVHVRAPRRRKSR